MLVGVPKEVDPAQTRVALTPGTAKKIIGLGFDVCVQSGAGARAGFSDSQYEADGAQIVDAQQAWGADVVVCMNVPTEHEIAYMNAGATLITRVIPSANSGYFELFAKKQLSVLALDLVPRITRAQSIDVLSSMMNLAGYRAVVEAAGAYSAMFGAQMTAAGKMPPANVYVIGVGVAGLAAIGTAKSLGANVFATDVRPEVAQQVQSLGGTFVEIPVTQKSVDGYAREMTADQQKLACQVYAKQAAQSDIVITTAQVPGRPAPLLLDDAAVLGMKPGSVVVDMGASALGGNCSKSEVNQMVITDNGVKVLGYTNLPNRMPAQGAELFGQNIANFFKMFTPGKNGQLALNQADEIIYAMTVILDGTILWPRKPYAHVHHESAPNSCQVEKVSPSNVDTHNANTPSPSNSGEGASGTSAQPGAAATSQNAGAVAAKPRRGSAALKVAACVLAVVLVLFAPEEMQGHFVVFALAVVVGFYVITDVSHSLHTPLMSVTNAISGIIIVGALLLVPSANLIVKILALAAVVLASINIFGGFLVTRRMLEMFQRSSDK